MNGFVITTNPPDSEAEPSIANDGWFPDMDPAAVRDACRIDGSVTAARLLPWADEQRVSWGYARLADVPAPQVGGESAKLLQYRRAIHAALQADLVQTYRGTSTAAVGNKFERDHDDLQCTAGDYLRQLRNAIADIRGQARCTGELI